MLGFPIPYNNELLYSTVARARVHDGETSPKQLLDSVFENRHVIATTDLPSHVQSIASQYPKSLGLDALALIKKHTLWPIYIPFIPNDRRVAIEKWLCGQSQGAAHLATGVAASRVQSKQNLFLCTKCVVEQKQVYGETFWDRRWQVPLVYCCPKHGSLDETNITLNGDHRHEFFPVTGVKEIKNIPVTESDFLFADLVYELFDRVHYEPLSYLQWTLFYRDLARNNGYMHGKRIDHQKIHLDYCTYWGKDWLSHNNILPTSTDTSWLKSIFRKHRKSFSFAGHLTVIDVISQGTMRITAALELALSYPAILKKSDAKINVDSKVINQDQKIWLALLETNNPKKARKIQPALYARLYRANYHWLMKVNRGHHSNVEVANNRVDWKRRDRSASKALLKLCDQVEEDLSVPRISKTFLLHHLPNRASIEKNLKHLPICSAVLEVYAESIDDYQTRRLANALLSMRARMQPIKRWSLLREAGLSEERMTESVKKILKEIVKDEV